MNNKTSQNKEIATSKNKYLLFTIGTAILLFVSAIVIFEYQRFTTIHTLKQQQQQQQDIIAKNSQDLAQITEPISQLQLKIALVEAAHLTRLANDNLNINKNYLAANKLLQAADRYLIAYYANPTVIQVRKTLANAIVALQSVVPTDAVQLIFQLDAISKQIELLPTTKAKLLVPQAEEEATTTTKQTLWKRTRSYITDKFKNIIIVRHEAQDMPMLLTSAKQIYVVQIIQYNLAQAEWAVLQKEQKLYEHKLQTAISLLNKYFAQHGEHTQRLVIELQKLQKLKIDPSLPDISATMMVTTKAMEDVIAGRGDE